MPVRFTDVDKDFAVDGEDASECVLLWSTTLSQIQPRPEQLQGDRSGAVTPETRHWGLRMFKCYLLKSSSGQA